MTEQIPRYLLAPPGSVNGGLREQLSEAAGPFVEVPSVAALFGVEGEGEGLAPGWIFLPPSLDSTVLAKLLVRLAASHEPWSPLLLLESGDALAALPLTVGHALPVSELGEKMAGTPGQQGALSFRLALGVLSRVRHDINNALTVALAEAQLLQLDQDPDSEAAASLRVLESQIGRIRDLVRELGAIRAPRR